MQSALKSRHKSFQVIDSEVSVLDASPETTRRRWSAEAKGRIVAEALVAGVNISAVARRRGLKAQQVFSWRRQALRSGLIGPLSPESTDTAFVPAEVERQSGIELIVGDVTIRVAADVSPERLAGVIRAVRSS